MIYQVKVDAFTINIYGKCELYRDNLGLYALRRWSNKPVSMQAYGKNDIIYET